MRCFIEIVKENLKKIHLPSLLLKCGCTINSHTHCYKKCQRIKKSNKKIKTLYIITNGLINNILLKLAKKLLQILLIFITIIWVIASAK